MIKFVQKLNELKKLMRLKLFLLLIIFLIPTQIFASGSAELSIYWMRTGNEVGTEPSQICLQWDCVPDASGSLNILDSEVVKKIDSSVLQDWVNTTMWTFCEYISQVEVVVDGCYGWKVQLLNGSRNDILDKLIGKSTTQTGGRIIQLPLGIQVLTLPIPYATGMRQKNASGVYEPRAFKLRIIFFR
jgi:hypothetical protein